MNSDELSSERRDCPPSDFQRDALPPAEMDHVMNIHDPINIKPRSAPYQHHSHGQYSYPPPHYQYPGSRHPIQSVVTTSFSTDEQDREDRSAFRPPYLPAPRNSYADYPPHDGRYFERTASTDAGAPYQYRPFEGHNIDSEQMHYARELPPIQEADVELRTPPQEVIVPRSSMRVPPSPREQPPPPFGARPEGIPPASSFHSDGPLKRSFWHHARPTDEYHQGPSIPNEFMPPKRAKVGTSGGGRRELLLAPSRTFSQEFTDMPASAERDTRSRGHGGWFNRGMSWDTRDDHYSRKGNGSEIYPSHSWNRSPQREGNMMQHWDTPFALSPRNRYPTGEGGRYELAQGHSWSPKWHQHDDQRWGMPQNRDDTEAMHFGPPMEEREAYERFRRQGTFDSRSEPEPPVRYINAPAMPTHASPNYPSTPLSHRIAPPKMGDAPFLGATSDMQPVSSSQTKGPIRLLALSGDRVTLSETLCLVRENIEVFTATKEDVDAPAPGRKQAIVVGQVGLRCIHCRHTTKSSERVKRAVCYPSSIKRIYRSVIDMKLDHFLHCKFVPVSLKDRLIALKANNTRSTGTTMQYFIKAASSLGMVDASSGVRLTEIAPGLSPPPPPSSSENAKHGSPRMETEKDKRALIAPMSPLSPPQIDRNNSLSSEGTESAGTVLGEDDLPEAFTGCVSLAIPEDEKALSPLRCFLREQVCAFSATEEDIAVRTPTTFSVSVGQVGVACKHCLKEPAKSRLNRAVCFPSSVTRIYQSVADIQRYHLGECKMVPADIKEQFAELQQASSKGSKGLATRQYWINSAKRIGLVDTTKGIRFGRDPSQPAEKAFSLDILAQVASHVTTVNRPIVLPEDQPSIAEFIYVVMQQLQPCRFTEADRNKRRLKDVGCIGVECKHCAGKVDSRKFFWSSVNAVESNFVSVHTHMGECKHVPEELKEKLANLKKLRKEQTSALKTGSQKAFFSRIWERLHKEEQKAEEAEKKAEDVVDMGSNDVEMKSDHDNKMLEDEEEKPQGDSADAVASKSALSLHSESETAPLSPIPQSKETGGIDALKTPPLVSPSTDKLKDQMSMVTV
ncbi:unnamed protein product [Cylindrotheca closterium]|uniref:Uncharacterized protein n=1 Tax=Cylindrotheca closterium TaxID=2856 RepID=A0AAD2GC46_9STRA|nr:unnamed protein product [Cylindrotheca closterium]